MKTKPDLKPGALVSVPVRYFHNEVLPRYYPGILISKSEFLAEDPRWRGPFWSVLIERNSREVDEITVKEWLIRAA